MILHFLYFIMEIILNECFLERFIEFDHRTFEIERKRELGSWFAHPVTFRKGLLDILNIVRSVIGNDKIETIVHERKRFCDGPDWPDIFNMIYTDL